MMETVYLGIDVHKKTYSFAFVKNGILVKKGSCAAKVQEFVSAIQRWFPGETVKSVYEAGFSGYGLHWALSDQGIRNIIIDPGSVVQAPNDRVKTDSLDARKMAMYLEKGLLKGIAIPSKKEVSLRSLTRTREQLVEHRKSTANQIKSFLMFHNMLGCNDRRGVSNRFLKEFEGKMDEILLQSFRFLAEQWRRLTVQIYAIRKDLIKMASMDKQLAVFQSIPGIGLITAMTLKLELRDILERFPNQKQLYSYTGLTPSEYSSGDKTRKGHISRKGPPRIRWLLTEAAWTAIRHDEALRESYERIAARRGGKIAIVAIARKLIGRLRACLRTNTLYITGHNMSTTNAPTG